MTTLLITMFYNGGVTRASADDVPSGTRMTEQSMGDEAVARTMPAVPAKPTVRTAPRRPGPAADPAQRSDLLAAASRLLAAEGPDALTVRRIAAEAGCSTMGVYSRFGGKDGIVEALFVEGFEGLAAAMDAVPDTDDVMADLLECGVAYRRFALAHPTSYTVMFERAVPGYEPSEAAGTIALGTFERLVRRVERAVAAGCLEGGDTIETTMRVWALSHGWVSLEIHGMLKTAADEPTYVRALMASCPRRS